MTYEEEIENADIMHIAAMAEDLAEKTKTKDNSLAEFDWRKGILSLVINEFRKSRDANCRIVIELFNMCFEETYGEDDINKIPTNQRKSIIQPILTDCINKVANTSPTPGHHTAAMKLFLAGRKIGAYDCGRYQDILCYYEECLEALDLSLDPS